VASITIRNLEDSLKERLRVRAARHGRSMEDETREILRLALAEGRKPASNLVDALRLRFADVGAFDLELPPREAMREPPRFKS